MKVITFSHSPLCFLCQLNGHRFRLCLISSLNKYFMMKYHLILIAFFFSAVILVQPSLAAINPKNIDSSIVRITKSGMLQPAGSIQSATLTFYIAQNGLQSINATPDGWEYTTDASGNRMIRVHFRNLNKPEPYSITQIVKTDAQRLPASTTIDSDEKYVKESSGAQITTDISSAAYPFERTLKGVAEMTSWVHDYVEYDKSIFGANRPSDWVFANKRGVCVEFSNLLAAMLRSKGIPTRYANGYAYSQDDGMLIGHTWVEVLSGGRWVGFDPTWLEGGFIDATHIRTSSSIDGVEKETLTYLGNGDVQWNKNPEYAELLEYKTANDTVISVDAPQNIPLTGGGYIKATVSYQGCRMAQLSVSPCTDGSRKMLEILGHADSWVCDSASAYWAFTNSLAKGYTYSCPVVVYDQSGFEAEKTISISGTASGAAPYINGPDSAGVNQPFSMQSGTGSLLFSTELGESPSNPWALTIIKPGTYNFYAYANGRIAHKAVEVKAEQEFELSASAPQSVNQSDRFSVGAVVRNVGQKAKAATIKAVFGNQTEERAASLAAGQLQSFNFSFVAYEAGIIRYSVSASADSLTGYSGSIEVVPAPEKPKGIVDLILDAIKGFFGWLESLFAAKPH